MSSLFTSSVPRPNAVSSFSEREYKYSDKEIKDLLNSNYFDTINLRPEYQRHIRWSPVAMNKFIDSVMQKRYIMPILMYRLQETDLVGRYDANTVFKYEVMDGQHRLYTLNAFKTAKKCTLPHVKNEFIVHWVLEQKDEDGQALQPLHIFYEKTNEVEEWCEDNGIKPEYLTAAGRDVFDETVIKVTTIVSKLTMNERRAEFLSLQNGIPVRNSDLLKNEVGCKLMAAYNKYGYENLMMNSFLKHCTKKAEKYITHWMARCYILFKSVDTGRHPSEAFIISDKTITKRIKESHSSINPSNEEFAEFDDAFNDFVEFLSPFDDSTKFNPTQMFALFYCLCKNKYNHEIVRSHMQYFSKEGTPKHFKQLWESNGNEEERIRYFNICVEQICNMTALASSYDERQVNKTLKRRVWNKCIDSKCLICKETITEKTFEAGHIIARTKGGQTELDNLIPICFHCNRSMGTRNAYEYKNSVYPSTIDEPL
jgi:5-methylcytosine-specific restriction endonuclease McrA